VVGLPVVTALPACLVRELAQQPAAACAVDAPFVSPPQPPDAQVRHRSKSGDGGEHVVEDVRARIQSASPADALEQVSAGNEIGAHGSQVSWPVWRVGLIKEVCPDAGGSRALHPALEDGIARRSLTKNFYQLRKIAGDIG